MPNLLKALEALEKRNLKFSLSQDGVDSLELRINDKDIDFEIKNREESRKLFKEHKKKEELKALKGLAVELKDNGYTLNIFDGKKLILRVGKEANPGLLSAFGPVEIKDLAAILKFLEG